GPLELCPQPMAKNPAPTDWVPVILADPGATITEVRVIVRGTVPIHLDDFSHPPSPHPDPTIGPGPPFELGINSSLGGQFSCIIDSSTVVDCASPFSPAG